jgi:hypothetical protein
MRIVDKEEFIERFLFDQSNRKKAIPSKKRKASILPFKEETYLDIINLLREMYGDDIEVKKNNDVNIKYGDDIFNIKVIAKRNRVAV